MPGDVWQWRTGHVLIAVGCVQAGHIICEQDNDPTEFYILMSGQCQVKVKVAGANDTKVRINKIEAGTTIRPLPLFVSFC